MYVLCSGWAHRMMISGTESIWSLVTSNVLQGSILGTVLFIIFLNDLASAYLLMTQNWEECLIHKKFVLLSGRISTGWRNRLMGTS